MNQPTVTTARSEHPERTLLIVAHEATRTGSPAVLLELMRRAEPLLARPLAVRLLAEGPLAPQLRALGSVPPSTRRPAAILVNSSLGADVLEEYPASIPSIVYVHEEADALDQLGPAAARSLVERADHVLAVTEDSRAALIALGVAPERTSILAPAVATVPVEEVRVREVRRSLCPDGTPLVVACGEAGWRKGADLFVDVARWLTRRAEVQLVWVGRRPAAFARLLDHDCRLVGVEPHLRWTGEIADVRHHLAAADLVMMTSREDPQPLVPLEAALLGTPTAGFDIGGIARMAAEGAAATVPYPDTAALAELTVSLLADEPRRGALAGAAAEWTRTHHDPLAAARTLADLVDRLTHP